MSDDTRYRALDSGGPLLLEEHEPPRPCAHGVCVEIRLGETTNELTLLLRATERHDGGDTHAYGDRNPVVLSLQSGRCSAPEPLAEAFLAERPWLAVAVARRLPWLRERAERLVAQRDRRSSYVMVLDRPEPGILIPYDRLFPADWDLVVQHDDHAFWTVDLHCPNPNCTCDEVVVDVRAIENMRAPSIGKIHVDMKGKRPRITMASSAETTRLSKTMWTKYGAELVRRHDEVRRAVVEHAARRAAVATLVRKAPTPSRNGPCPCGSGKKCKRCCADRVVQPSGAVSRTRASS